MTRMPSKLYAGAGAWLADAAAFLSGPPTLRAQKEQIVWSDREKAIMEQMRKLRGLPDDERVSTTKRLAVQLRQLPAGPNKEILAEALANLVTEGEPGPETLQEVAITLAQALREQPAAAGKDPTTMPYLTLAQLGRYEHVQVSLDDPRFAAAMAKLEADDRLRQSVDFHALRPGGEALDVKGAARQRGARQFLGHLVSTLPRGDARSGNAVSAVRTERAGHSGHLRRRSRQSAAVRGGAPCQLSDPSRPEPRGERAVPRWKGSPRVSCMTVRASSSRRRLTCERKGNSWRCWRTPDWSKGQR